MRLEKLRLNNFKNYSHASVKFNEEIVAIVGENGAGKTNLIDAIYYLLLTKSAINSVDSQNIAHDENVFFIKGSLEHQKENKDLLLAFEKNKKKVIKVDGKEYEKISDHIGRFPVVMIAPDDVEIILGGSEQRRKFFDGMLAQVDKDYLEHLLVYQRYLKQKNSALKKFAEDRRVDHALLDLYDKELLDHGKTIYELRQKNLELYLNFFIKNYKILSDDKENVAITYQSQMKDFESRDSKEDRKRDVIKARATWGIHKDDYLFTIVDQTVKKFASQGQRKSFLTALKLAQFEFIREDKGFKPILLLDDIFDKLDDHRISHLIQLISDHRFGQIFITDARAERTIGFLTEKKINFQLLKIKDGEIHEGEQ